MGSGQYNGIREAYQSVESNSGYSGPSEILAETPSPETIVRWTDSLTGFEADANVSRDVAIQLDDIDELYERSKSGLEEHAARIGVKSLNEFSPDAVLFMVCIRDLQNKHAGKANLNPHKFSVLRGGRYSVD